MRGRLLFAYSLVLTLAACGGGGGGGSGGGTPGAGAGGGGGSSTPPPPPPQVPLVFSGVSTTASVSATNGGPIAANLMSALGAAAGNSFGMQVTGGSGLTGVDATRTCDSGTMQVSGTVASDGTGTLSINYNACRNAAHTLNGPATLQINAYDRTNQIITDGTVTMTRINVSGPGMNSDVTGTVRKQVTVRTNTE